MPVRRIKLTRSASPVVPEPALIDEPCIDGDMPRGVGCWSEKILTAYNRGKYKVIILSQVVFAAHEELAYGGWAKLLAQPTFPLCKKNADDLVTIGKSLGGLPDEYVRTHLPVALGTLHQLALMDRSALLGYIGAGRISPKLKELEARDLLDEYLGRPLRSRGKQTKLQKWFSEGRRFFLKERAKRMAAEIDLLSSYLSELGVADDTTNSPPTTTLVEPSETHSVAA